MPCISEGGPDVSKELLRVLASFLALYSLLKQYDKFEKRLYRGADKYMTFPIFLFAAQLKEFFLDGLKKLEQRSHKCVELGGGSVEELSAPLPTPKLEDHTLSAVQDCLFHIFVATLHIWRPSPPAT
jgi:hypothetical protein